MRGGCREVGIRVGEGFRGGYLQVGKEAPQIGEPFECRHPRAELAQVGRAAFLQAGLFLRVVHSEEL